VTVKCNIRLEQPRRKASERINDPHSNVILINDSAKNKLKSQQRAAKHLDNLPKDQTGDARETSEHKASTKMKRQRPVSDSNGENKLDNSELHKRASRCSDVRLNDKCNIPVEQPRKTANKRVYDSVSNVKLINKRSTKNKL